MPRGSHVFTRAQTAWLLAGSLLATLAVSAGWLLCIDSSVEAARAMVAGLLIALAAGVAAGLSGLRGGLARRVIALVAAGGFGLLLWPPGAALLEVAPLEGSAIAPVVAMLLAAAALGVAMRRPPSRHRVSAGAAAR